MKKHPLITSTAKEFKEKHLGPIGTPKRDKYEKELAEEIEDLRKERDQKKATK